MSEETQVFTQAAESIKEIVKEIHTVAVNQARLEDRVKTNYSHTDDKLNTLSKEICSIKKIVQTGFNSHKPLTQRADINESNIERIEKKIDEHLSDTKVAKQEHLRGQWQMKATFLTAVTALLVVLITVFGPMLFPKSHVQQSTQSTQQPTIERVK